MKEGESASLSLTDQVEVDLGEQLLLTTWRVERKNPEFQAIDNKVQEVKSLLRQRLSQAGREEGVTLEDRGIKYRYYDAALKLAEVLSGVLRQAPEIAGKAVPEEDQAINYPAVNDVPKGEGMDDGIDDLTVRNMWESVQDNEKAIERGEAANNAQNHFGESLVKVFNDLGWPGEELETILKDKKLIW